MGKARAQETRHKTEAERDTGGECGKNERRKSLLTQRLRDGGSEGEDTVDRHTDRGRKRQRRRGRETREEKVYSLRD